MIDKTRLCFPRRRDLCVNWPDGRIKHHPACFIEEREDGSIVLYGRGTETTYAREEYRRWFLDDTQIEEAD